MNVFTTFSGQSIHVFSKSFSFDSFLILGKVGCLRIGSSCLLLFVCVVIYFFEDNQDIYDIADLLSELFAFCSLLYDELGYCSCIKFIENLPDEFFLDDKLSELKVFFFLSLHFAVLVFLF